MGKSERVSGNTKKGLSSLMQRVLAGVVGLLIVIPLVLWGGYIGVELLVLVVMLIAVDEFSRMATPGLHRRTLLVLGLAGGLIYGVMVWGAPGQLPMAFACAILAIMIVALFTVHEPAKGADITAKWIVGLLYVPFLVAFIPILRQRPDGIAWLFLLLVVTWAGDTGAYFAGKAWGKTKLLERVSPKKTIEGAIGGAVAAVVGALCVKAVGLESVSWVHVAVMAIVLDVAGVLGDLVESQWKRAFGVKDSGWIMPGHGGLLDRVDSLLFSAPAAVLYLHVFQI